MRGRASSPKVGIFRTGTHDVVDIPRCLIHHPLVNRVAAALRTAIRRTGVAPYGERTHRGVVRYLQVVVERSTQRAQVVVVTNGDRPAPVAPLLDALGTLLGEALHSLWWNGQPERTNAILGPHWVRVAGAPAVEERIGGARVFFPPGAFGQANLHLADRIVARVSAWVPDGARVLELYAGCGAVGLGLAEHATGIAFNEAASDGLAGLTLGIEALPPDVRGRVRLLPGDAADQARAVAAADTVIADPPRKGLDAAVLDALIAAPPERFVLVSCSVDALVREAAAFAASRRMRLAAVVPYALFPFTEHVETVALFMRASRRDST